MTFAAGADHRIDRVDRRGLGDGRGREGEGEQQRGEVEGSVHTAA